MNQLLGRSRLFDDMFREFSPAYFVKPLHGDALPAQIKIDVNESEGLYTVQAEIPGVKKDDIHIAIDNNQVTISAEIKQHDSQTNEDKVLRSERYYGSVSRSFQLSNDIDQANAKAKYTDGILMLSLPKKSNAGSKRLTVD
jgi:HSP20 family protein